MNDENNFDIKAHLIESMLEIFDTMLSLEVEYTDIEPPQGSDNDYPTATVEFSGDATGILVLQVSTEFARRMTAASQGVEAEKTEEDEEIQHLISEIANIAAEKLKEALTDSGLSCELSLPSTSTATGSKIDPSNMGNYERLIFRHGEEIARVEVAMNLAEKLQAAEEKTQESQTADDDQTENQKGLKAGEDFSLDLVLDIPIELTVELGRAKIQIHELLQLGPGSAVPLSKLESEPVDILANDTLIARGQVVIKDEKYGIRVTEITSRMDRIKSLS